jgi:DNA-binding LytR/AlgR family response regulator
MDIQLADGLSFEIFQKIEIEAPIIFTTAYDKYAIKAFEVNSIDYLLKPIQSEKLEAALDKFEQLQTKEPEDQGDLFQEFKKLLSKSEKDYKSRFLCKLGNKIKSIPTENIKYFYSKDKMTFLVDQDKNRLPVNNTLDEIDQMLDPNKFFKINRQYISSFDAITEINPYFKGRLKLKLDPSTEDDIVVSSERSPLFKAWLNH